MHINRPWALWRRIQYLTGLLFVVVVIVGGTSFALLYQAPTCFDGVQNGDEAGTDCGGNCVRICAFEAISPTTLWAESFEIANGRYNAVAYIENVNVGIGSPEVKYTFKFFDDEGLIMERSGTTILPPDSVYPIFEGRIEMGSRVPTRTSIELEDVELWLPASAGREQFVVEKRTLQNVDTSPRLDAEITNTALTEAKDVEIVTTIFDQNRNPLTASRTIVPIFDARSKQNVIFTWPEPIAKTIRSCEVPTDVVMAIDLSGSMNDDGTDPPEPITSVLRAAEAFVDRLKSNDQISVVTYATEAQTALTLTRDKKTARSVVGNLSISPQDERGSTNTGDAILAANSELASVRHSNNARKVAVLLTDGLANAPGDEPEQYALDAASTLKNSGTEIFSIALGDNVNEAFLQQIATDDEHYFKAASVDTVDRIYRSITEAICEDGPAVIEIIPKTTASFATLQ